MGERIEVGGVDWILRLQLEVHNSIVALDPSEPFFLP